MELRDFIAESLKQIIDGVKIAQTHAKQEGGTVNPKSQKQVLTTPHKMTSEQQIDFDLAITVNEGTSAGGKVGVFTGWIGGGVQGRMLRPATSAASNFQ